MQKQVECLRCRSQMQEGYLFSNHEGMNRQQLWYPGVPERSFLFGLKIKKGQFLSVTTFRCLNCGYLESYALNPPTK